MQHVRTTFLLSSFRSLQSLSFNRVVMLLIPEIKTSSVLSLKLWASEMMQFQVSSSFYLPCIASMSMIIQKSFNIFSKTTRHWQSELNIWYLYFLFFAFNWTQLNSTLRSLVPCFVSCMTYLSSIFDRQFRAIKMELLSGGFWVNDYDNILKFKNAQSDFPKLYTEQNIQNANWPRDWECRRTKCFPFKQRRDISIVVIVSSLDRWVYDGKCLEHHLKNFNDFQYSIFSHWILIPLVVQYVYEIESSAYNEKTLRILNNKKCLLLMSTSIDPSS